MGEMALNMNSLAEKEADSIGRRFMNSRDVLGDMGKIYNLNLKDKIRLHDDTSSHRRVDSVGKDAVASGSDIFFGSDFSKGSSSQQSELLAHEVAHTMQQSGEGGMSQSVSDGSFQGGTFDRPSSLYVPKVDSNGNEISKLEQWLAVPEVVEVMKKKKKKVKDNTEDNNFLQPSIADFNTVKLDNSQQRHDLDGDEVDKFRTYGRKILSTGILGSIGYAIAKKDARYLKRNWLYRTLHGGMAALMTAGGLLGGFGAGLISLFGGGHSDQPFSTRTIDKIAVFGKRARNMAKRNAVEGIAFLAGLPLAPITAGLASTFIPGVAGSIASSIGGSIATTAVATSGVGRIFKRFGSWLGRKTGLFKKKDSDIDKRAQSEQLAMGNFDPTISLLDDDNPGMLLPTQENSGAQLKKETVGNDIVTPIKPAFNRHKNLESDEVF